MNAFLTILTKLLADIIRGWLTDLRNEQRIKDNALYQNSAKNREALKDARQTIDRLAIADVRRQLQERAHTRPM